MRVVPLQLWQEIQKNELDLQHLKDKSTKISKRKYSKQKDDAIQTEQQKKPIDSDLNIIWRLTPQFYWCLRFCVWLAQPESTNLSVKYENKKKCALTS